MRWDDALVGVYRAVRRPLAGRGLGRIGVVARLRDTLRSRATDRSVIVNGHRMYIDAGDSLNLLGDPHWEPVATRIVRERVREGMAVIDVGAHIGYFTMLFADLVGPTGEVIAFEPDPRNFALLAQNVRLNGYRNVRVRQEAVADETGRLALSVEGPAWGHHLLVEGPGPMTIEVAVVTLDDAVPADTTVDFVKIDAEGAERRVFSGLRGLLQRAPNLQILAEFWPAGLIRADTDPRIYLNDLTAAGFRLFDLDEAAHDVRPIEPASLLLKYPPTGNSHTNLLCLRS